MWRFDRLGGAGSGSRTLAWMVVFLLAAICAGPRVAAQSVLDAALLTVGALEARIAERRTQLERERERKQVVEAMLADLRQRRTELERALVQDVHVLYRLRRSGLLPMAEGLDALMRHASRVAHLERMADRSLHALQDSRAQEGQLAREAHELELAIQAIEEELAGFESARAQLLEPPPAPKPEEATGEVLSVRPAEGRMSYGLSLVGARVASPAGAGATEADESDRFEAQRGALAMPVSSATSISPTQREDGNGRGVELTTEAGMSVRAAADGRVLAVERNAAGSLRVVIEHGPRFRTIYSGLASADVEPGDAVSKSARLGSVGSAPIYFEVRHGRRSQDARSWLGL